VTVVPFTMQTHRPWCDRAQCSTDRFGVTIHESSQLQIGDYTVCIMGDGKGPPAVMLNDEVLSSDSSRPAAWTLAADPRPHVKPRSPYTTR
jgi:hypothetical protein